MKNRIRELREEAGLKQGELASILGIKQNTLSTWETGRYEPDNEMLRKIADYFDVTTDYVLGRSPLRKMHTPQVDTMNVMNLLHVVEQMTKEQFSAVLQFAERVVSGSDIMQNNRHDLSEAERDLLSAYRIASDDAKAVVDLTLKPWMGSNDKSAVS